MNIKFTPEATKILYFDLEFFVPVRDRRRKPYPFISNPHLPDHLLLGGVFKVEYPLQPDKKDEQNEFWLWHHHNERELLQNIYNYFNALWKDILSKKNHASLTAVGISIARADLPYLFSRCLHYQIDNPENLYDCFYNIRTIDLNVLGIPFFKHNHDKELVLYPKPKNDLLQRFEIEGEKKSGHNVWELYDAGKYDLIENRTQNEVNEIQKLYYKILKELN